MKVVTSDWGDAPRLAEVVVERPVRLQNMASNFVISSYIVRILFGKQSFLEETFFFA